ncbi:hypothetical protein AA0113_g3294 [Alternaria arborescens]|uniref:Uncharacterized protein n=1 Tax=Alternaria arborescens TaxID=156630 RepID=A0A4Q4SJ64_9PLEO|nr:hypothetical protein AA0111_g6793 [Alternaria arborescens]RYN31386.1 hypothetical protein AA0112_g6581 [Alternaria arborescens]RYO28160.1 hypothetical protein AA0111_g6793 [Alternaria arborescens]RYO70123.1 hypothetical protein AA0113_g3294 [Alternaria arborescens]
MAGVKRSINGLAKPQNKLQEPEDVAMTDATPPCGQPQPPSSETTSSISTSEKQEKTSKPNPSTKKPSPTSLHPKQPTKPRTTNAKLRQKLPKLPKNTKIVTRPLLHAPLSSPFSSSGSAKTLYITATTPYIPTVKRVRKLLNEVVKREKQSANSLNKARGRGGRYAEANGRLEARDVEAEIVGEMGRTGSSNNNVGNRGIVGQGKDKGREEIYLKATGRAIPRALELGLHFQSEEDCWVMIEMGNVSAIDDIEVESRDARGEEGPGEPGDEAEADDVPETRIRTLSSVTVSIGLK